MATRASTFNQVSTRARELREQLGIPGVAVGVWHEQQVATAAFGVTSVENPLPVTEDTLFQLGSISKVYTAAALLRLVEEGRLELDAPVRRYLPAFSTADPAASEAVTLRHLLTHRVGWPGDVFDFEERAYRSMAAFVAHMSQLPQVVPPGTLWCYANSGILVAGRVIEVVTGQPFPVAMRSLLLGPLGLEHTALDPGLVMTYRFAAGHVLKEEPDSGAGAVATEVVRPWPLPPCADAEGGVAASLADVLRFARFHLGHGDGESAPLTPEMRREMQTPQAAIWEPYEWVGLVWNVDQRGALPVVSHGGRTPGTYATLMLVPERDFACAILTNANRGNRLIETLRRFLVHCYLGFELPPPPAPRDTSAAAVRPYTGRYDHPYFWLEVTEREGQPVVLFGSKMDVLPPEFPPMACALYAEDRLLVTEGYLNGCVLDVFRRPDGAIGWLRDGDTLYTRVRST